MGDVLVLIDDLLVEVRDVTLTRVGTITPNALKMKALIRHNDVGDWQITLPGDHPMMPYLSADGSGIIVSLRGVTRFSGDTVAPKRKRDRQNPDGTFTFSGVTDDIILADARAYPQPGNANVATQAVSNDVRTAAGETLMRQFVAYNIANGAIAMGGAVAWAPAGRLAGHRLKLRLESPGGSRGVMTTKSPRFQILLELLQEIGEYNGLGFRVVQRGNQLVFEVVTLNNRSDVVRFDIENGTVTSEEVSKTPPAITRAIVAGQGEGVERQIVQRTSVASLAAETATGRVREVFIDQRDTNVTAELQQSGDEQLIAGGFVSTAVKIVPSDDTTMLYGVDWVEGDTIAVIVNDQQTCARVSAAAFVVDQSAVTVGAAIGDVTGFATDDALAKRVEKTEQRVENLERTESSTAYIPDLGDPNADRLVFWDDSADAFAYLSAGSRLSISGTTLNQSDMYEQDAFAITTPAASFPKGTSVFLLSPVAGTPYLSDYGNLTTIVPDANGPGGSIQYWNGYQTGSLGVWYRQWYYGAGAWTSWQRLSTAKTLDVSSTNLDNYYADNIVINGQNLTNAPDDSSEWFYVDVKVHSGTGYAEQIVTLLTSPSSRRTPQMWRRMRSAGTWSIWQRIDKGGASAGIVRRTTSALTTGGGAYANMSANAKWGNRDLINGMTYSDGFIVPLAGIYVVEWQMLSSTSRASILGIAVNAGSSIAGGHTLHAASSLQDGGAFIGAGSAMVRLDVDDKLTLWGYSASAATMNANANEGPHWGCRWVAE